MKHPKWLLIIVLILLVINIVFYTVWYAFDIQGKVKVKLEAFLSKTMAGTVTIQKLSINDRHITANDIIYIDKAKSINLKIKQLQVRYNLLKIIFSGFKIEKAINLISVYEPNVIVRYDYKPKKNAKPLKIPDLVPFFSRLEVKNGKLDIIFSTTVDPKTKTNLRIEEKLNEINLVITNKKDSDIRLKAATSNKGTFDVQSTLAKGLVTNAKLQINQYRPFSVQLDGLKDITSEISVLAKYKQTNRKTKPDYTVTSILRNTSLAYDKYKLSVPYIHLNGDDKLITYDIRDVKVNGSQLSSKGSIYDIIKHPSLNSTIDVARFELKEIEKNLVGVVSGKVQVSGDLADLKANGNLSLPSFSYQKETITGLTISAQYASDSLSFITNEFNWREQAGHLNGYFLTKSNKLGINLTTNPIDSNQELRVESDISGSMNFNQADIKAEVVVNNLSINSPYASVDKLHGTATLVSDAKMKESALIDVALDDSQGLAMQLNGDLITLNLNSTVTLDSIYTYDYSQFMQEQKIDSAVSGSIIAELKDKNVVGNCHLSIDMASPRVITTNLTSAFNYHISDKTGNMSFTTDGGYVNKLPFSFQFNSAIDPDYLKVTDFNLDDAILADGWLNLKDLKDFGFHVKADSVDFNDYWTMINNTDLGAPLTSRVNLELDYNHNHHNKVYGFINASSEPFLMIKPVSANVTFKGTTQKVEIDAEVIASESSKLTIQSTVSLLPELNLVINGNFDNFMLQDILTYEKTQGSLDGSVQWTLNKNKTKRYDSTFSVDIKGNSLVFQGFPVDSLQVKIIQLNELLNVENLHLVVGGYFNLSGKGSLDYNIITNNYGNGNHYLNLAFDGDLLKWLDHQVKYIEDAKGRVKCNIVVKAGDEGLVIENGTLSLSRGMVQLKDQVEKISGIELQGRIVQNQLKLDNFSCQIGQGKLYIRNDIDSSGDNFYIGPLNLGYFLVRTDDTGIQVYMPDYMPENTTATAIIKGQNSKEAYIKGPFDDMEIKGEILCSNGSALYPANTNNLMQLMNFFRAKKTPEEIPLPMTLDLKIIVKENVHYVTYPANLRCLPESFLHLTYDGTMWNASEAEFQSEQGTLDFYGSIFDVEFVKLVINLQQKIIALNGTFIRKAPDGTLVTLSVTTNLQKEGDLFNQLEFKLTSDNPEDKTAPQILSRLRYNRNIDELSPEQRQSLLQDEAMQVIGNSVNTAYIAQWLSPVENTVRKFLKLDNFSISTGFIQNLYLQYGTNNQEKASFADPKNLNSDIVQFSSSVLLNNLSLSMGKYLGRGIYLDYQIQLQEATDLAKKTKLVLYHNTTLRYSLPWKLRLSYTYSIKPLREPNTHEIMVQRSFHF